MGFRLISTYAYDHRQRRTRKVTTAAAPQGARTIVYHYDEADRLIAETSETGVPLRSYLWADDTLLAQVEYQFNATSGLYTVLRELIFELDHLGTPRQARLTDGTVVWRWESDGYGNTAPNQDPDGNGQATYVYLRFPGQYYDEESGLHYNWHRYYAPRLGRYLSSDPIGINGGGNTYAYVGGNPLSYTDPLGLYAELCARPFYPMPVPYARHCFVRFNGNSSDTSSFDPSGTHQDPAPDWWPKSCSSTNGNENDECIKKEMQRCQASQYDFTGFNCCHCAEQAMKACGISVRRNNWPNWPVNPGPQPGEPGYRP